MMLIVSLALALTAAVDNDAVALDANAPFVTVILAGSPVRLRVDFAAHEGVTLNPDVARRLGLRRTGRMLMNVGPLQVRGDLTNDILEFAGRSLGARIVWYPRVAAADADGVIGPASLPAKSVRLTMGPHLPTDRTYRLPASTRGDFGVHSPFRVGAKIIAVEFSPHIAETRAPAATAAVLAKALGGQLTGPEQSVELVLGILRPARRMMLAQPLMVAGLRIRELLVRIGDYRVPHDLPPDADAPADEVRVVARDGQRPRFALRIGADHLTGCSEIAYSAPTSTIELTCSDQLR